MKKNLLKRVEEESKNFESAEEAAIDNLNMCHAHLFENFEGHNLDNILTDIDQIIKKVENLKIPCNG